MILLDTQILLWLLTDKSRLSERAADTIREVSRESRGVAIAGHTLWEVAMVATRGRLKLRGPLTDHLRRIEESFRVVPLTGAIAARSMLFSLNYPRDPADRIIGATAVVHGLPLITADKGIHASKEVECIW